MTWDFLVCRFAPWIAIESKKVNEIINEYAMVSCLSFWKASASWWLCASIGGSRTKSCVRTENSQITGASQDRNLIEKWWVKSLQLDEKAMASHCSFNFCIASVLWWLHAVVGGIGARSRVWGKVAFIEDLPYINHLQPQIFGWNWYSKNKGGKMNTTLLQQRFFKIHIVVV